MRLNNGFWFEWLDLLALRLHTLSQSHLHTGNTVLLLIYKIYSIQSSQFTLHSSQLLNPTGLSTPSSNLLFQLTTDWQRCCHFSYKPSAWAMQKTEPLYCYGNVFTSLLHGNGLGTDCIEKAIHPLLLTCMLRTLPSKGQCLQSHCLAMGLYTTV
jgi:hypothetical protein